MEIIKNYDLTKLNTFGVKAQAKFFVEVRSEVDFEKLLATEEFKNNQKLFLGYGSNILFTKDFDGLVIQNKIKGIEIISEDAETVFIKAMSGEDWNDLIDFATSHNYWGAENLALIPSSVGASPVQNIGAYGCEVKDIIESVEVIDIETGEKVFLKNTECEFGYRESAFKNKFKDKYFILAVVFKLSKTPNLNVTYKALKDHLDKNNIEVKCAGDISCVVSDIRKSKLPDPKILGNAGSFFKNVYVSENELKNLLEKYPEMPYFKEKEFTSPPTPLLIKERGEEEVLNYSEDKLTKNYKFKIPTGWLIEQCNWKGKRLGNVGVYEKQALILVNYGGATGAEIKDLSDQIITSVSQKFGITLTPEVNFI